MKDKQLKNNLIKLVDIVDVIDGDRGVNYPSKRDFNNVNGTLFLSASNITKFGFSITEMNFISQEHSIKMNKGTVQIGDIVITSRGTVGNNVYFDTLKGFDNIRINSGMLIFRPKNIKFGETIFHYLKSPIFMNNIQLITSGSAQPQLTKMDVSAITINSSKSTIENKNIGKFFSQIDKLIYYTNEQSNNIKFKRISLLRKIFSDKFINKNTEFIKLDSAVNYISSNLSMGEVLESSSYCVYGANSIVGYSEKYISDEEYISIVKDGAGVGRIVKCCEKTNILGTMGAMTVKDGYDLNYITQFLKSVRWDIYVSGSTIPHLYFNDYKNMKVISKSLINQKKIGAILYSMDELELLYKEYSNELNTLKKYKLNKIFG